MHRRVLLTCVLAVLGSGSLLPETVAVRHAEGLVRGFLVLRTTDGAGAVIATGDLIQTSQGDRVTSRLVFHFRDGSIQDETAVFTQSGRFRLVSDTMIQKGPSFPHPMSVSIAVGAGRVVVRFRGKDGKDESLDEKMDLPEDLANGMALTLLKNISPEDPPTTVSMLVATPKPRIVKLVITPSGQDSFFAAGAAHRATRFTARIEIGGIAGVVAKLVGKQPHDTQVWILGGEAPGFVKSEGPFFAEGPVWRIELAAPDFSRSSAK
jgi:hypothetical protein